MCPALPSPTLDQYSDGRDRRHRKSKISGQQVTKTIPSFLRIHCESQSASSDTPFDSQDSVNHFWNTYADTTGWRLDHRASRDSRVELLPAVTEDSIEAIESQSTAGVSKAAATRLAESASRVARELQRNREAIRRQEAELASRAPILAGEQDRAKLADQIEQTLSDATVACGCDAAAMYMLDDETKYLKTRAIHEMPVQRLEEEPRELRLSRGDLESMVQGVVAVDDLDAGGVDTWNCPESFAAGICASIESDGVPIGTLWCFKQEKAEFTPADTAAARLAASKLSLQLATAATGDDPGRNHSGVAVADIAQWQYESLPIGSNLAEGWHVDGMIESKNDWATGWHAWDILPDGTLMLVVAEAVETSTRGAMHATVARAALVAHAGYRHTPAQMLQRISDSLWQTSTGEQLVSLLYARVDPETGEGEVASAGSIAALIGNRYGFRPLTSGTSDPLNAHIDARCISESFRMTSGETLLAYTDGIVAAGASQRLMGEQIRSAMESADEHPLARVRRRLSEFPVKVERGAVTLTRR